MTPVSDRSFGLLIAYLLPGFSVIWLWGQDFPAIASWLAVSPAQAPSVGGFLYVTLASIGVGLTLSTLRWAMLDKLHHATGISPPDWNHPKSAVSLDAYRLVVDLHYRYYQFYGSTLFVLGMLLLSPPQGQLGAILMAPMGRLLLLCVALLFYAASRDALSKYYSRFFSISDPQNPCSIRSTQMTNGGHHDSAPSENLPPSSSLSSKKEVEKLSTGERHEEQSASKAESTAQRNKEVE